MYKVIVFAGTTEGYEVCRFLSDHKVSVLASVATEYGTKSLETNEFLTVQAQRLSKEEMCSLFSETKPDLVIDATHPYAAEVTANILEACKNTGGSYERVLRASGGKTDAVYVESTVAAVDYLKNTSGSILLTTGSKELPVFTELPDYKERLYARVLSVPTVISTCRELGFEGQHLIAMQGPFSQEMNEATLRQYDCRYLVTKDTGKAGGFEEKIEAAKACGATPVIIGRPVTEEGLSVEECKHKLFEQFSLNQNTNVTLLGIGMGSEATLTVEGKMAVEKADLIIGAKRIADAVLRPGQPVFYEYNSEKIVQYIKEHPEYENVVIALSGDVGFYSGAKKLVDLLGEDTNIICGISSVVYFMAKIGLSWDDAKIVSAHGKNCNLISLIRTNKKVFAILGTRDKIAEISKGLVEYEMGDVTLYVGERLSYEDEKIFAKKAEELTEYAGDALSVVCICNEKAAESPATHGLPDEAFIRGKAPMTKSEVRTVSLAKLCLSEGSVCYDIGAGTGSVSIEMALRVKEGHVYAIEKKEEAAELIYENKKKFALDNLTIVKGLAPDALEALPLPTHAFIGGSSGNLKEIMDLLLKKNPYVRIVINCITLETVAEALAYLKDMPENTETEIVQLGVARSKSIASYHMMMGENPIYIITVGRRAQ